ncbi:MAG TPA: hypothetical protein VLM42_18080 [Bryobacteraceae bacterium]|nr:hypothetical protein [Bryobacteraceae bacterium]
MTEEAVLTSMADWRIVPRVAAATALKAQELGLARDTRTREQYIEMPTRRILDAQNTLPLLMREDLIAAMPVDRVPHADPASGEAPSGGA